jgi:entericidin B
MKVLAAILAAAVLSFVAGCNTMEGVGQDVQAGGRAVERAADKSNPTTHPNKYGSAGAVQAAGRAPTRRGRPRSF